MGCSQSMAKQAMLMGDDKDLTVSLKAVPLSRSQIAQIQKSWRQISANEQKIQKLGTGLYLRIFATRKDITTLFPHFVNDNGKVKSVDAEIEMENFTSTVMYTLDEAISLLSDPDVLFELTNRIGQLHIKLEGFDPDYFWAVLEPFLEQLKLLLGLAYTKDLEFIYRTAIRFILRLLYRGYFSDSQAKGSMANGR